MQYRPALILAALVCLPALLLTTCKESPTSIVLVASPPDSLPADPVVGFWPHPGPSDDIIRGWSVCAGATGILINVEPPWWEFMHQRFALAQRSGYSFILYPVWRKDSLWEYLGPVLRDSLVGPHIDALFVDEPFSQVYDRGVPRSHGLTDEQFYELVVFCHAFGKRLAFAFYQVKPEMRIEQLTHAFEIVRRFDRLRGADMAHRLVIMPDNYFNCSPAELTTAYARICQWAEQEHIPRTQVMPWIGPSCVILGKPESDCGPNRTYDAIREARSLGFGGWFIYPGNGINADHVAMMLAAHRNLGIATSDTCAYDLTY